MTEVVAALIWDKNKFLICQRPAHKARGLLWEFVGGKAEPGETNSVQRIWRYSKDFRAGTEFIVQGQGLL